MSSISRSNIQRRYKREPRAEKIGIHHKKGKGPREAWSLFRVVEKNVPRWVLIDGIPRRHRWRGRRVRPMLAGHLVQLFSRRIPPTVGPAWVLRVRLGSIRSQSRCLANLSAVQVLPHASLLSVAPCDGRGGPNRPSRMLVADGMEDYRHRPGAPGSSFPR